MTRWIGEVGELRHLLVHEAELGDEGRRWSCAGEAVNVLGIWVPAEAGVSGIVLSAGQLLKHVDQLALDVVGQLVGEGRQAAETQALGGLHPG